MPTQGWFQYNTVILNDRKRAARHPESVITPYTIAHPANGLPTLILILVGILR